MGAIVVYIFSPGLLLRSIIKFLAYRSARAYVSMNGLAVFDRFHDFCSYSYATVGFIFSYPYPVLALKALCHNISGDCYYF